MKSWFLYEKKYAGLALVLSTLMIILGWFLNEFVRSSQYQRLLLPPLEISFGVSTTTGRFESWYTHTPITASAATLKKDAAARRQNLLHLIAESRYDSDTSPVREEFLEETDSYTAYTVYIPTEKGYPPAGAQLYIPKGVQKPAPAILFTHGHFEDNTLFQRPAGEGGAANFHAVKHAEAGFITLAVENRGTGYFRSRQGFSQIEYINYEMLQNRSFVALAIQDARKALAYLRSRPDVDTSRIGVAGVSLGGELAGFIGALDQNIKAVVVSGYLNLYQGLLVSTSVHDLFWPGILSRVGEAPQIISLIAPRPLLIQQGTEDIEFYAAGYRRNNGDNAFKYLNEYYSLLGHEKDVQRDLFIGGHIYNSTSSIEFFNREL